MTKIVNVNMMSLIFDFILKEDGLFFFANRVLFAFLQNVVQLFIYISGFVGYAFKF